jgi:hypothetical protein
MLTNMTRLVLYRLVLSIVFARAKGLSAQYKVEIKFFTIILATLVGSEYVKSVSTSAEYLVCSLALVRKYGHYIGVRVD